MKSVVLALATLLAASCAPRTTSPLAVPTASAVSSPGASGSATPSATDTPARERAAPSAVRFVDATHGWLGVEDGLLGTADGGATWDRELTSARVVRIWAYDATHAWALSADDAVFRTQDGTHWTGVPATDPPITYIQFVTPFVGWAIATGPPPPPVGPPAQRTATVLASTDGGFIWRPVGSRTLWAICFVDERNGWGADGKRIFRTTDAGRTWTQVIDLAINDSGPWYPTVRCRDATSARVQISEPYAALSHAPYLVYRTSDAGRTWDLEYREAYTLGQTTPPNTPQLGSYPSLFETLADGHTWFVTCTPPLDAQGFLVLDENGATTGRGSIPFPSCVGDASFVDAQHGWVIGYEYHPAGSETVLSRTSDGARTWMRLYPP